ncbi:MAG: hypothetical protein RL033_7806 [Pseudomonadota bacterium]|jgi:DNA-binding protein HU-beta
MTQGNSFFSAVTNAPWDDVLPLAQVLGVTLSPESATVSPAHSAVLWKELSYLGSNDLAYLLRGFEGVDYPEIVRDVCKSLKVAEPQPGEEERTVELNELHLVASLFARAWIDVDADQRRELLRELNLDEGHVPMAGVEIAAAVSSGKAGPFAQYKLSRLVASSLAGVLPPGRLSPARRKTVQAVVLVASLRQAQRSALAQTALAPTALADTVTPAESHTAGPAQPKQAKRRAARKAAARLPDPPQAAKKKPVRKKAEPRPAKTKPVRKKAEPRPAKTKAMRKAPPKKLPAKKAVTKKSKKTTVKAPLKKKATKKRRRSAAA